MNKLILITVLISLLFGCQEKKFKLHYDHADVMYIDKSSLPEIGIQEDIYVSAYSDLYYENQSVKTYFTVILSLRNISFTDTIYFNNIDYYSSEGKLLRKYIDDVLVLRPMESMEYIVQESEREGGTGANFVVSYSAKANLKNPPFIETVMMGNLDNYRFAFMSRGVRINK